MKKYNLWAFIVATLFLSIAQSCNDSKLQKVEVESVSFKNYSGYDFSTLSYFDIPIDYKSSNTNNDNFDTLIVDVVWDFDSVVLSGFYFLETDANGCVNRIGFSDSLRQYAGISVDIFISNSEFNDWNSLGICSVGKIQGGLWEFLRNVFIGIPSYGPCIMHTRTCWHDHWLVGPHSFETCPC